MAFKKISDVVDKLKVVTRFGSNNYSSISRPSSVDKYLKQSDPVVCRQNEFRLPTFKNEYLNYIVKKSELKRNSSYDNFTKIRTNFTANYAPLKSSRWFYGDQIANQRQLCQRKYNKHTSSSNKHPKPLKTTLHLPLYSYKKWNYTKKKSNKSKRSAKMDAIFKQIYYGRIVNNYFYKVLARDKTKSTQMEKNRKKENCVIWPSLYRYKGPPVKNIFQKHFEKSTITEEPLKNFNTLTAPNKVNFKTIQVNKDKGSVEAKEFFKNLNKTTKVKNDINVRSFNPGIIVRHERMYQPLYQYKGFPPSCVKIEQNLVKDANEPSVMNNLNNMETAKDTANIRNETLTMQDIEFMTKVNERTKAAMNLLPINQAENVKNIILDGINTNHRDPISIDLRNPATYQKNSTDLNTNTIQSNETSMIEQHLQTMKQNQNIPNKINNNAENIKLSEANKKTNFTSNTKKNSEIYKTEQQINTIQQNQNIANKTEIIQLSKNMNQIKNEPTVQNNISTNKQITPNSKKTNIQRNPKTYQNSLNNTRIPVGGHGNATGVYSNQMKQPNRHIYTSAFGRNIAQIKPSLLGSFTSVNKFSTSARNLDKLSYKKLTKYVNCLVKLIKINNITNNSKITSIKPYPEKQMSKNWLLSQQDAEPGPKFKVSNKEAKEMISDITNCQKNDNLNINSSNNKEPESKASSSGQQTTASKPISKEFKNKQSKRKIIDHGPLIWRCEHVLSKRRKEIQRGDTRKPKNLVYSSNTTNNYDPIYFCKNKTCKEKLNSDYLQNKSKRIGHNVRRSKSDYSLYRFPYNEAKIGRKSSKNNNVDSIRINYICTAQNKMRLNKIFNSPTDLETSSNLPSEDIEEVFLESMAEKQDHRSGKATTMSSHPINMSSQFVYFKPSFPDLALKRNKSAERMSLYHNTSVLNVSKSTQTTLPEKSCIFPKNANDILKNVLEKVAIKSKQKLYRKHAYKPFAGAVTVTTSGIPLPLNVKLKQKPEINNQQYNSLLKQCATLEADKILNSNLLYNRNIMDNTVTRSHRLSANDKRSGSTIKDSKTFPKFLIPKPKPLNRTISAGIGLAQNIKIPPKPSSSCKKSLKKCIKEIVPSLKQNSNHYKSKSWYGDYINNQDYLILYEKNNLVSKNERQNCRVESLANLGPLLIENQKKNQELLTNAIINPNYLNRQDCLSPKNENFLTKMKDNNNKEENKQSSQLISVEQLLANFEPNSYSMEQTSLNNNFKEEILNTKQSPFSDLNVHSKPLSAAKIKSEATEENNNNNNNNNNNDAFQMKELQKNKLQDQKVKVKETSSLKSATGSKQKLSYNVVDSQPVLLRKNIDSLNSYIPLAPFTSKNETRKRHEKNKVHPDLAKLLKHENGIFLTTDKDDQNENQNAINKLKYLTQGGVNQKNEEKGNLGQSEIINDSVELLNEENKCSEQLEKDEFPENNESIGKHNLNVINMPEQNSCSSKGNNEEIILPTETRNAAELINSETKGKDFKVNIGTQTINKLLPLNDRLKLPKLKMNCEKSWYTEQLSGEKKLLLLQISKEKQIISK